MVFAYVGTFTRHGKSRGIYVFQLDVATGALNPVQTVNLENPTYLVASSKRQLYVAIHSRRFLGRSGGGLVAFAWDETTGRLTRLGHRAVYSPHPAYVSLDRKGPQTSGAGGRRFKSSRPDFARFYNRRDYDERS